MSVPLILPFLAISILCLLKFAREHPQIDASTLISTPPVSRCEIRHWQLSSSSASRTRYPAVDAFALGLFSVAYTPGLDSEAGGKREGGAEEERVHSHGSAECGGDKREEEGGWGRR